MNATTRFGARARHCAAFRPGYPAEAIDAVLEGLGDPGALTIADVGAGTGISARLFAQRGVRVIAIEPNARMRGQAQLHERVTWTDGTGEATGLQGRSVDAIVACQAFHWFATQGAMHEFRRVARRRAALLQYERDERDAFTRAYGDVVRSFATDDTEALRQTAVRVFSSFPDAAISRADFSLRQRLDIDGLLGRAASASYLPSAGPAALRLREDLQALFSRFARDGAVELAIQTYVITADW